MPLPRRKSKAPPVPFSCPLSECMSFLRGAWAPNVIWYLSAAPRRFSELRADIPRVSAKVLSTRLHELEEKGIVLREVIPSSPPTTEYSLTDLGRQLVPAIAAIVEVGHQLKTRTATTPPRSVVASSPRASAARRAAVVG